MTMTEVQEGVEQAGEAAEGAVEDGGGPNGDGLAKRILIPAAAGVGTLAATYAVRKAPELFRDKVMPRLEQEGGETVANVGKHAASQLTGEGGVLGTVAEKAASTFGRGGKKKTRRLPIQRWTDIAMPVETVYERWTEFEEFPKFMHRVLSVEKKDDDHLTWQEKIWFSTRRWEGEIVERRKNARIAWKTVSGTTHSGVVTFHSLANNLTRVMVTVDFEPSGIIEKMGSGLRFVKRAVQADLARFKAHVEMDEIEGLEFSQTSDESSGADDEDQDDDRSQSNGRRSQEESDRARQERAERREQRRE